MARANDVYHLLLLIVMVNFFEFLSCFWNFGYEYTSENTKKILKQVEYESARRKRHISEKTRKRDEEGSTFFLCTFIKGTQGNTSELI